MLVYRLINLIRLSQCRIASSCTHAQILISHVSTKAHFQIGATKMEAEAASLICCSPSYCNNDAAACRDLDNELNIEPTILW